MYSVVGCRECGAFWIVEDRPDTTGCPRCGTRHPFERLKKFITTEAAEEAREVRSRLIAERIGYSRDQIEQEGVPGFVEAKHVGDDSDTDE